MLAETITLDDIAQVVTQAVSGIAEETSGLKKEFGGLKREFGDLKQEFGGLKQEFAELKTSLTGRQDALEASHKQLAQEMRSGFARIDAQFKMVYGELATIRVWIAGVDNRLKATENDVKDIFKLLQKMDRRLDSLEKHYTKISKFTRQRRVGQLLKWAEQVSRQTGIPLPRL